MIDPTQINGLLLDYGVTILLGIFNFIFLIVKIIKGFGVKIDDEYKDKVEPVFKWIFFVLSILGVIGAFISVYRFIVSYHTDDKTFVTANWVSLILTILLAFINITSGILYVSSDTKDYIQIILNKSAMITTVNISNITYYAIFIIINLLTGYEFYLKYTNKS
tara:strand:- start:225 stop:713 length:489 start_codon:yes stop_codon:yes gene_type:complete